MIKHSSTLKICKYCITVIGVLFSSITILKSDLCRSYASDVQSQIKNVYPATPESVIENEHKNQYEYNFQNKSNYFLEEAKCEADCVIVVQSFFIKKIAQSEEKAKVKIEFNVVGTFCPGYIGEKEDNGNTLTKTNAGEYNEFDIFTKSNNKFDKGIIIYDLIKEKNKWKIVPKWKGCPVLYISIESAIKIIEDDIKLIKNKSIIDRNLKIINYMKILQKDNK
ncbi:MAG: hypothetical protein JXR79_00360 [Nitrospirae bacterium]|nr:hypothetical protein [Nitrospirota bacterium]